MCKHLSRFLLLAITLVSLQVASLAACATYPRTEQGLRATETHWLQAVLDKDKSTLNSILSSDFTDSSMNGALRTRDDVFAYLSRPRDYDQKLAIDRATVIDQTGIVVGRSIISDSSGNRLAEIRFTDTFIYRDGRWVALAAQETRIQQ